MQPAGAICRCGKALQFPNEELANEFLNGEHGRRLKLTRVYKCSKTGIWHVTRQARSTAEKFRILEEELHMATIRENILSYMEFWYEKGKKYKFHTNEVAEAIRKKSPTTAKTTVAQELSKMKKLGLIVGLDDQVPNVKGAKYFALAKHLEEVTKPETKGGEKIVAVEPKKPSEITVAVNPFDKVNSQLGEILSKINGLATGYAQLVDHAQVQRSAVENSESVVDILRVILDESRVNTKTIHTTFIDRLNELKTLASSHVTVDGDKLADVINTRLSNVTQPSSLIRRIRDELDDRIGEAEREVRKLNLEIAGRLEAIQIPTNFGTLSDEEKYRLGMRDGIKLAAEMGIILPDA